METTNLPQGGQGFGDEERPAKSRRFFIALFIAIFAFSLTTKGAHDLWASTVVYLAVAAVTVLFIWSCSLRREPIFLPLRFPVVAVFVLLGLSFWRSSNPSEAYLAWMDWTAGLAMLFLAANLLRCASDLRLFDALLLGALVLLLLSTTLELMPTPLLINQNLQAAFLLFWVPVAIARWRTARLQNHPISFWFWGAAVGILLAFLYMSKSVWAWICLAGYVAFMGRSWGRWRLAAAVFVVLGGVIAAQMGQLASPTDRFMWWSAALGMLESHPFLGVGIGNFPSAYLAFKTTTGLNTLYAHSMVLSLLAEVGLLGVGAIVVLFGVWWFRVRSKITIPSDLSPYVSGVKLFLAFAAVNLGPELLVNMLTLFLFVGICASRIEGPRVFVRWSAAVVITALSVGAVPFLTAPFFASRYVVDARAALESNELERADRNFKNAMELDPRAWESYQGLAQVAARKADLRQAESWQQQAIQRNRLNVPLQRELENYRRLAG